MTETKKKRKKERLDNLLVERGLSDSREKAKRLILSGSILVNDAVVDKSGAKVSVDSNIHVKNREDPFVSRGGVKLKKALDRFQIDCRGMVAMDVGASTGGFTDCLLQCGAEKVFAIDVGYGQLDWRLRQDRRVILLERKNARYLSPEDINNEKIDLALIDVSFISLKLIMPPIRNLLKQENGAAIALIKPQFEAGKDKVGKGGIIRDPGILKEVLADLLKWFKDKKWGLEGVVPSPILGKKGNREFLIYLKNRFTLNSWEVDLTELVESLTKTTQSSSKSKSSFSSH